MFYIVMSCNPDGSIREQDIYESRGDADLFEMELMDMESTAVTIVIYAVESFDDTLTAEDVLKKFILNIDNVDQLPFKWKLVSRSKGRNEKASVHQWNLDDTIRFITSMRKKVGDDKEFAEILNTAFQKTDSPFRVQ